MLGSGIHYCNVVLYILQADNPTFQRLLDMDEQWLQLLFVIFFVLTLTMKVRDTVYISTLTQLMSLLAV